MESKRISHYEVGRLLGCGGMGEVFEAVDLELDRRVALKFVAPELAADPESLRRFEREARSAAALTHPHIATLYAFERGGPRPFIAMELIVGETLRARITRGPLPVGEALGIARDVASALAFAHRRGIIHRDIKPENLMFDQHGAVKVMDFGLARVAQASRLTTTGAALGTPGYMAPETIRGGPGVEADVFALGVVLHEMLAGELPFKGDDALGLMFAIVNEPPKPLRESRPEVPVGAETVVLRMLEKAPALRPDAEGVTREMAALTSLPAAHGADTTGELEAESVPAPPSARVSGAPRRRRVPRALILAAALVPIAWIALGMVLVGRRGERRFREAVRVNDQGQDADQQGRIEEARARFEATLARYPRFDLAMVNLAGIYRRQGLTARAESLYTAVLGLRRARPDEITLEKGHPEGRALAHLMLGWMNADARAWSSAVAHFDQSLAIDSVGLSLGGGLGYSKFGHALVEAGRPHDALPLLERTIVRFPAQAALYNDAGFALLRLGRYNDAVARLDRALALDSGLLSAHGLRAQARAHLGDASGARADWEMYVSAGPDSIERAAIEADLIRLRALPRDAERAGQAGAHPH